LRKKTKTKIIKTTGLGHLKLKPNKIHKPKKSYDRKKFKKELNVLTTQNSA